MELIEIIKGVVRFDDAISSESVARLLSELESKLKEYKEVLLYFTCNGGSIADAQILLDYLNRNPCRIEIMGAWSLASCGFDIMLFFMGKKNVIDDAYGVIHLGTNSFDLLEGMDKKSFGTFHLEQLKRDNTLYLKKISPFLTSDEYNRVEKGEDVYLNSDRLREIFGWGKDYEETNS